MTMTSNALWGHEHATYLKKSYFQVRPVLFMGMLAAEGLKVVEKFLNFFCSSLSFFKVINNCFERWWQRGQTSRWPQVWTRKDRQTKMVTADPRSSWINQPCSFLPYKYFSFIWCFLFLFTGATYDFVLAFIFYAKIEQGRLAKKTSEKTDIWDWLTPK